MDRSWFDIMDKGPGEADIHIYDEIGGFGVGAKELVRALQGIKSSVINLFLNSPGGDVYEGLAIYESLKRHPATINVRVDGIAASCASFIAQAGDRIIMATGATMMIHEPYAAARGNSQTMTKAAEWLNKIADGVAAIYAGRAGGTREEWRKRMQAETWYRAQEAVDAGLADEVATVGASNMALRIFNLSRFNNVPPWLWQVKDAGRTMSQGNLNKLHSAMTDMAEVHKATCDMGEDCPMKDGGGSHARAPLNAEWTTAYINDLPDSAFAYIAPGGSKDDDGKTTPRSLRYLPHHDAEGGVDLPHLRNALSRAPQTGLPAEAKAQAIRHLQGHARREGVGEE